MLRKLINSMPVGMLLLCLTGCSGIIGIGTVADDTDSYQNLASAVTMIRKGLDSEARHYLELVIVYSREEGVTDEALFRLALLNLNDGKLGGGKSTTALLEKLRVTYPTSVWTRQAAPLQSYLLGIRNNRSRDKEITALQEKNLSLSKDVRELRQIIDRLKALDSELEQKIRR